MTVNSTTNRVEYAGDGASTVFAVGFYFLAAEDLKIYLRDVNDSQSLLTITTHYSVADAGNPAGGSVTLLTAPAVGEKLVIIRDPAITQLTDYQANDAFPAETHERALDKLTMQTQRLSERADRALVLPESDVLGQGAFEGGGNRIANLADPINPKDASSKEYVDERIALVNTSLVAETTFENVALAAAAQIDPSTDVIFLEGYATTGDGGHALYKAVVSEPTHAAKFQDSATPQRWWEILPINGQINPIQLGAIGDAATDDTTAVQNAADAAGILGCDLLLTKIFSVSTIDFNYKGVLVEGLGSDTGFIARNTSPPVRSRLANRIVAGSLESTVFRNFAVDGNGVSLNCFQLERFTRGCGVHDCLIFDGAGDGFDIFDSWSFSLERNRIKNCTLVGMRLQGVNLEVNAWNIEGNHISGCGEGVNISSAQNGVFSGNTSEYNVGVNFTASGRSLQIEGNYFEGFDAATSGVAGSEYNVVLGISGEPFLNSSFVNYVNGGSNGAASFDGDGVHLVNVINSKLHCSFSLSTRYPFAFSETATIIGNDIDLSFDAHNASLSAATIRNLTDSVTSGIDALAGASVYGNRGLRVGGDFGIRSDFQIEPDGTTGSIFEQRVIEDRVVQYQWGKLTSTAAAFTFDSVDRDHHYKFENGLSIPVMTSTQRDAISSPVNGMIVLNTTTGKYQGYKEVGTVWVDFH